MGAEQCYRVATTPLLSQESLSLSVCLSTKYGLPSAMTERRQTTESRRDLTQRALDSGIILRPEIYDTLSQNIGKELHYTLISQKATDHIIQSWNTTSGPACYTFFPFHRPPLDCPNYIKH